MTPRSIRRAQERKSRKEAARKARQEMACETQPAAPPEAGFEVPDAYPCMAAAERHSVSLARLQANRANAQLSTGPTSSEGRAKASLNAVKTALTGRTVLLPSDDAVEYQRHVAAFAAEYAPATSREADLVQSIADTWWRMQRIPCLESAIFAQGCLEFADAFEEYDPALRPSLIQAQTFLHYEKQIRNLQLQEARLFRRYEKDRAELMALQERRRQTEIEAAPVQAAAATARPVSAGTNGFEFSTDESESPADPKCRPLPDSNLPLATPRAQAA